jgi:hypothetical protein
MPISSAVGQRSHNRAHQQPRYLPLGRFLHALIPERLRRWMGEPGNPDERDPLGQAGLPLSRRLSEVL